MHMSLTLDAAIANTIHCIMDCVPLLPLMTRLPCELSSVASSFLSDWEEMIYCGPMMRNAVPTLGTFDLVAPTIQALLDATGSCAHRVFSAYRQWTLFFSGHFPCNPAYRSAFTVSWLRNALLRWHLFLLANHGTVLVSFVRSQRHSMPGNH